MLFNILKDDEKFEIIPYYYSATTVSHKSTTPYMENPVYKAAMASEPDIVVILLGMNDSKVGNFDEELFVKDYKKMITDFSSLKSKPTIFPCMPTPIYIDNFTM